MNVRIGLFAALAVALAGCTNGDARVSKEQTTASVMIQALVPASASVSKVVVKLTWDGGATPAVELPNTAAGVYGGLIEALPAGVPCSLDADALDSSGTALFIARLQSLQFQAGRVTQVLINLQPIVDSALGSAPVIDSILFPQGDVLVESLVDLVVNVHDDDDTALSYALQVSSGSVDLPSGGLQLNAHQATLNAVFTAPSEPGQVTVSLRVEDPHGLAASLAFPLRVVPVPDQNQGAAGEFTVNFPPEVERVVVRPGATAANIELAAEVRDDGPLSELAYRWTGAAGVLSTTEIATLQAGAGVVPVSLQVSDRAGASSSVDFSVDTTAVQLVDAPITNHAPAIVGVMRSGDDVSWGDTVVLRVWAEEPDGDSMSASWQGTCGQLASGTSVPAGSQTLFETSWQGPETAGACEVRVVVRDARGAAVAYRFVITEVLGRVRVEAAAGLDKEIFAGDAARLDASASTSANGSIASYLWEQVSGPPATIASPTAAVTTLSTPSLGNYTFRVTVRSVNDSDTDEVTVRVVNPLAFSFADAAVTNDGVVFFLDTGRAFLRRYDLRSQRFLPLLPAITGVIMMALAPAGDEVYLGDGSSRIDVLNLATGTRSLFAMTDERVLNMVVAGDYLLAVDKPGSWVNHSLWKRSTKHRTSLLVGGYYSRVYAFAPGISRVFHLRDSISPNDLIYTAVNQTTGTLGGEVDSPYHGSYQFTQPIRVFPDESRVAVASGTIFSTSDLTIDSDLGTAYTDLAFSGTQILVLRGTTNSEVVEFNSDYSLASTRTFPGAPKRIFAFDGVVTVFSEVSSGVLSVSTFTP